MPKIRYLWLTHLITELNSNGMWYFMGYCIFYILVEVSIINTPLPSARQHLIYGDCLKVQTGYYQNSSMLDCVTQCSQSAAHLCEQLLQVKQIGFVTLSRGRVTILKVGRQILPAKRAESFFDPPLFGQWGTKYCLDS